MITEKQYNEAKKIIVQYEKEQLALLRKSRMQSATSIPMENWGVHSTHCCVNCGCKYGDEDCPVMLGLIKQQYKVCQDCD